MRFEKLFTILRKDKGSEELLVNSNFLKQKRNITVSMKSDVTDILYYRINNSDVVKVLENMTDTEKTFFYKNNELEKKRLILIYGVYCKISSILEKTGLSDSSPPDNVHAMSRGVLASGGTFYYADIIAGTLKELGINFTSFYNVLDFGCSSGRVIRAFKPAFPEINFYGVDPNKDAIEWASKNLKGINFTISPVSPPLNFERCFFDFVFAISIWSHYGETNSVKWLDEMWRIIKPNGILLITTHGFNSVAHNNRLYHSSVDRGLSNDSCFKILKDLYLNGFSYLDVFGKNGDWGVKQKDWGIAFLTLEWLLEKIQSKWNLLYFKSGEVEGDQDLIVLRRLD